MSMNALFVMCTILIAVATAILNYIFDKHRMSVGLWGLVNNAGLNFIGDAELTTMDQYINEVNINQLGVVRVTKAFLPEIRRKKGLYIIHLLL